MRNEKGFRGAILWRCLWVVVGLVLLGVVRQRLGRWVERHSAREIRERVVGIALALVGSIAVCELVLRFKDRNDKDPRQDLPEVMSSETMGWALRPSRTLKSRIGGREVTYAVNHWGFRARDENDDPDPAAPTLIFVGESIMFGLGVDHAETIPAIVGRGLGVQVVNASVHGYGGDQAYLRTLEVMGQFKHPLAVVAIVLAEQVERNVLDLRPRLRLGASGALEMAQPTPEWLRKIKMRTLWRNVFPYHDDEAVDIERAVLRASAAAASARGAAPLFVVTNYHTPCLPVNGEPPWLFRTLFEEGGLPRLDVPIDPTWKLSDDPHPDARAHRKIAEAVERALREMHLPGL